MSLLKSFTRTILPRRNTTGLSWLGTTGNLKTLDIHNKRVNHRVRLVFETEFKTMSTRISKGRTRTNARAVNPNFLQNRIYGKVVQFRSLQTKYALMCKIHEQKSISADTCTVYHNGCQDIFQKKMCNTVPIKQLENSLQLI
jgi:hypothetical protein